MNRSYNHIKHSFENNDIVNNIMARLHWQDVKHDVNQLDSKQRHAGFDYYEYDVLEFGTTPGRAQSFFDQSPGTLNFQEHLEDLVNDQTRHQGIHSHGCGVTCYSHRGLRECIRKYEF